MYVYVSVDEDRWDVRAGSEPKPPGSQLWVVVFPDGTEHEGDSANGPRPL